MDPIFLNEDDVSTAAPSTDMRFSSPVRNPISSLYPLYPNFRNLGLADTTPSTHIEVYPKDSPRRTLSHHDSPPAIPNTSYASNAMVKKYMAKFGFDVNAGKGLGADGSGIAEPIIPTRKNNKYGLGRQVVSKTTQELAKKQTQTKPDEKKNPVLTKKGILKTDARSVRQRHEEEKQKHKRLSHMFYGNDESNELLEDLENNGRKSFGIAYEGNKSVVSTSYQPSKLQSRRKESKAVYEGNSLVFRASSLRPKPTPGRWI